ncbi:MAG: putative sulfate exporter family transporter [Alistipes sp.]|nr:putative sulfate exporter family transporter [Alistipes sp.]
MAILSALKTNNKVIYIVIVSALALLLLLGYIPALAGVSAWVTPPVALFLGLAFALLCGQAYPTFNKKVSKKLLQYSVVGLGFGMNLHASLASGKEGMMFTIVSVVGTMVIGMIIGHKMLKMNRDAAYLISSGTAICGGSAIAAVGPVIKAKESDMSVALATIFILNAIALFIFPLLGEWMGLTQQQFGTWAAIAIHDTSSVVGAGAAYGEEALQVATTIKLTRALWIIPLALITSVIFKNESKKISIPWFILWFVVAILINTYLLDSVPMVGKFISGFARKGLIITMFFIGASLSTDVLKAVGIKPLIQGVLLWIVISVTSLLYILYLN